MSSSCPLPRPRPLHVAAIALVVLLGTAPPAGAVPESGASDRVAATGAVLHRSALRVSLPLRAGASGPAGPTIPPVTEPSATASPDAAPSAAGSSASSEPVGAEDPAARWLWPVAAPHPVLRGFEPPEHAYGPGHRGIDIGASEGAQVHAVEGGVVRFAGMVAGRPVVSITHGDGLISTYEPVQASVKVGEQVTAGAAIGVLAASEHGGDHCAAGPCLHLGARRGDDDYADPEVLLGERGPSVLLPWDRG